MTAQELIEELSKLPQEADVRIYDTDEYIHRSVKTVEYYETLGEHYIDLNWE